MSVIVAFGQLQHLGLRSRDRAVGFLGRGDGRAFLQRELSQVFEVIAEGLNGRKTVHDDPIEPYR